MHVYIDFFHYFKCHQLCNLRLRIYNIDGGNIYIFISSLASWRFLCHSHLPVASYFELNLIYYLVYDLIGTYCNLHCNLLSDKIKINR